MRPPQVGRAGRHCKACMRIALRMDRVPPAASLRLLLFGCLLVALCALGVVRAAAALALYLDPFVTCAATDVEGSEAAALDHAWDGDETSECVSVVESMLGATRLATEAAPLPAPTPVHDLMATIVVPTPPPATLAAPGLLAPTVLAIAPTSGP